VAVGDAAAVVDVGTAVVEATGEAAVDAGVTAGDVTVDEDGVVSAGAAPEEHAAATASTAVPEAVSTARRGSGRAGWLGKDTGLILQVGGGRGRVGRRTDQILASDARPRTCEGSMGVPVDPGTVRRRSGKPQITIPHRPITVRGRSASPLLYRFSTKSAGE